MRRWEFYKEDTPYFLNAPTTGDNPLDPTTLTQYSRSEPYHGQTPGWLVNLFTERRWFAVNGRFTYAGGDRNFILNETALGTDRFLNNQNRQVIVSGNGAAPGDHRRCFHQPVRNAEADDCEQFFVRQHAH